MRRNSLISIIFAVGSVWLLQAGCQETAKRLETETVKSVEVKIVERPAKPQAAKQLIDGPAPKIVVLKPIHDFGKIGPGTKNTCEFKFTNTGDSLLKINKIQTTCGCTVPELAKKEYAPGESGTINVRYSSPKTQGAVTKHLYIHSNAQNNPKARLTIKAGVVLKIAYEPKKLNLLLKDENAGCGQITIKSLDGQPFSIKRFKSTGNSITADIDSSVEAMEFVLQPKVDIEKLKKSLNGRIEISLTHPQGDTVIIPFKALPRFKISPPSIIAFNAEPQKPIHKELWILNNYDEDFEIESTSSKNGIIKVLSQKKVDNRYQFELEIMPPAAQDKKRVFSDVFYVNIKGGEKLHVNCRGFYARGS